MECGMEGERKGGKERGSERREGGKWGEREGGRRQGGTCREEDGGIGREEGRKEGDMHLYKCLQNKVFDNIRICNNKWWL